MVTQKLPVKSWHKFLLTILIIVAYIVFLLLFQKINPKKPVAGIGSGEDFENAQVISVLNESLSKSKTVPDLYLGSQRLRIKVETGRLKNRVVDITNNLTTFVNIHARAGDHIVVTINPKLPAQPISVYNYQRSPVILIFVIVFILLLGFVGGRKGVRSVIGLLFTLASVFFVFIPMLYNGWSAVFSSVITVILITTVTMLLIGEWTVKTLSAILGTVLGTAISGVIAELFCSIAHLTGFNTSNAEDLVIISETTNLQINGLIFAAILISSLGAVMDISMTIASSVYEIHKKNNTLGQKELFVSGLNIGRDMMGTMANTLILAYVGSSLNMLLFLYSFNVQSRQFLNMNQVGVEIIQGLAGSFAVILAVPIVSFITAKLVSINIQLPSQSNYK